MASNGADHSSIVAELATLHDISSLGGARSYDELGRLALEKALRLFGAHRFGLWGGRRDERRILATAGLGSEAAARARARQGPDHVFVLELGKGGELGLLFMEKATPLSSRERRVYDIFSRRLEECLVALRRDEERERALAELKRSEDDYRQLFEQSIDAVYLGRPDGSVINANEAWLRLFGYSREDIKTLNAIEFYVHPEQRSGFKRQMEERGHVDDEVLYRRKDGSTFRCQRSQGAMKDVSGQIVAYQGIMRNVTELRGTERALRESEAKYRALFEQSLDAIWSLNPDGSGHEVNQAWLDMFGYVRDDLPALNAIDLYEDPAYRADFLRRISQTGFVRDEVRFKRKDGTAFDVERTVVALRDATGAIARLQGVSRDVTERRAAERALRQSEERFRSVMASMQDVVFTLDTKQKHTGVYGPWVEAMGLTPGHFLGKTSAEILGSEAANVHEEANARALQGEFVVYEWSAPSAGMELHYQTSLSPIRAPDGTVSGIVGVGRDITARRRAERGLQESEERYRALFELSSDAAYLVTIEGRIIDVNRAWHELFGYTDADLPHMTIDDIYTDPADRNESFVPTILRDGRVVDWNVRFRRKDGAVLDCLCSVVARRDDSGNILYLQGFVRDVTQQKRDQEELERSHSELRRLAAHLEIVREEERAAVAWELHDEVGQELSAITMDLHSALEKLPREMPSTAREALERATLQLRDTIARLRRLYSKLRPGMLDDLGLAATIEWQLLDFSLNSGIESRITRLDDIQLADGDAMLSVYRAFQEAIDNVVRHSGATHVEVSVTREGGQATLRVADDRRGVTDEELCSPTSLGLAAIRERLRACGGTLSIRRSEAGGTVVEATAPLARKEDKPSVL